MLLSKLAITTFVFSMILLTSPDTTQAAEVIMPVSVRLISMEEYQQQSRNQQTAQIEKVSFGSEIPQNRHKRMYDKLMINLDGNQDGQISRTEFNSLCRSAGSGLFAALDSNGNRLIDRHEIENYAKQYAKRGC